mgnify:CR=1 FL=1
MEVFVIEIVALMVEAEHWNETSTYWQSKKIYVEKKVQFKFWKGYTDEWSVKNTL